MCKKSVHTSRGVICLSKTIMTDSTPLKTSVNANKTLQLSKSSRPINVK